MSDAFDEELADKFRKRMFQTFSGGVVTLQVDLAVRTGLLETLAAGGGTTAELADRAGLQERYVRECLGTLVTAYIVEYDAAARTYSLPAEHAAVLTGGGSGNVAPLARMMALLATHVPAVATAFREGGGVPYEAYRPEFTTVMDKLSRGLMDGQLIEGILPIAKDLPDLLAGGVRAADVGCGTGHAVNLMGAAFPASRFVGFDFSDEAIAVGRAEAAAMGLTNVEFAVHDVSTLPTDDPFDVMFAFDAIHDQRDPASVLRSIHASLRDAGLFVMMDIRGNSALEDNVGNPFAPMLYGVSTLHCMPVSLALDGAGLGTMWGEQTARQMLTDAGFGAIEVHPVPEDPMDSVYLARKGAPGVKTGGMTGLDWGDGVFEKTAPELLPATAAALAAADLKPGETVLDVGTGTGNAAVAALRRGGVRVMGVDPAPRLLAVARARTAALGLPAEFKLASATALPVPDASQDLVLSVFAVIFEPNGPGAVAELIRVTRPGGRIVLTTWTDQGAVFRVGRRLRTATAAVSPPPEGPPPTDWIDPAVVADLFAAYPVRIQETVHPLTFHGTSPEGWFDAQEADHPAWRAGRRLLDDATWAQVRKDSIDELTSANEDPAALAVTSTFRVLRIDLNR